MYDLIKPRGKFVKKYIWSSLLTLSKQKCKWSFFSLVAALTLTSTGSSTERMSAGSEGKENLEELFLTPFIFCTWIESGDILQRRDRSKARSEKTVFVWVYVPPKAIHISPINVHADLTGVNDCWLSIHLSVIQQSALNVFDASEKRIWDFSLRTH